MTDVYERLYNDYHIHTATTHTLFRNTIAVIHKHSKLHQNE